MTIQIHADGAQVPVRHIKFSDGCSNLVIDKFETPKQYLNISVDAKTPGDAVLFEVLMALDAITGILGGRAFQLGLALPYLPHGRADRQFEDGSPTPVLTFLEALLPYFDTFYLTDPHSEVPVKYLESYGAEVLVKSQADCFKDACVPLDELTLLIAPDKGAKEKTELIAARNRLPVVYASKVRDVDTGLVVSTELPLGSYSGRRCVIVDDIADGGGTFIPLAQALLDKGAAPVELYVTHGIFAKGLEPFRGIISKIHVYQIVSNYITRDDLKEFNQ